MVENFLRVGSLDEIKERRPTFLAVGVFDGVHLGHRHLLTEMIAAAQATGASPAVLTFFPHPMVVVRNLQGRLYLTTLAHRVTLLSRLGIELVVVHPFDEEVRGTRAADFVDRLCAVMDLRELWGGSFSLGYQREGTAEYLSKLGAERGFVVRLMEDLVKVGGERVSSSRIRQALADGDIEETNRCLGRRFQVEGTVIRGEQRGRLLGFHTANLAVWDQQILPANGVYATYAYLGGERFAAASNVGVRPTVNGTGLSVEAYLLDFDREIYGRSLTLEFVRRVRPEHKFPNLDALKEQIAEDVSTIRALL